MATVVKKQRAVPPAALIAQATGAGRKPKSEKVRLIPDRDWFETARARDALGRTWKELAPLMGLDPPMLTRTLTGERGMTLIDLVGFARVLGVAVLDVLRHSGVDLRGVRLVGESDADPQDLAKRIHTLQQELQTTVAQRELLERLVHAQMGGRSGSEATGAARKMRA